MHQLPHLLPDMLPPERFAIIALSGKLAALGTGNGLRRLVLNIIH